MEKKIRELEKAYNALSEARTHLYRSDFNVLAMKVQELYEHIEEILDRIYEVQEEKAWTQYSNLAWRS